VSISLQILEGCKNQNNTSQQIVYNSYYGLLLNIGMRYFNEINDAKLMVNESFFKIFTKIDSYNNQIAFEAWISRIMINTCIDNWRKTKKIKINEITVETHYDDQISQSYSISSQKIEHDFLISLLDKVPEVSRKVFLLFAIEGYSHKEIGSLLNINEGTSKWHVNNARKILKELIINYQISFEKKTLNLTKNIG
jgi:RNA polymerase sigma factor (sigma-70 family)